MTEAVVVHEDVMGCSELIEVAGHRIQLGGAEGDGYCYVHADFDCVDALTEAEYEALRNPIR